MKHAIAILLAVLLVTSVFAASMELTSARLYKKQMEFAKSIQYYDQEIQKVPGNLEAYFERAELFGIIALDTSRTDLAKQLADKKDDPMRDLLEKMMAGFKTASKANTPDDESTVKKLKKKMDRILTEDWEYFYFLAVKQDSSYLKAVEAKTTTPDPKVYITEALRNLDIAILLIPDKWNSYGLKAQILKRTDQVDKSAEAWEQALLALNNSETAKKDAENFAKAMGIVQENLLQIYYNAKKLDKAVAKADEILAKEPKNEYAIQIRAYSMAEMTNDTTLTPEKKKERISAAIKALNEANEIAKDDAIPFYIGQFNLQLGDTAAAVAAFTDYLKKDEKDETVLFNLGVVYLEGGTFTNTEKAREMFQKLTETHPENAAGWINLGVSLLRLQKTEEGKAAINKGKEIQAKGSKK
jgi:tetratricopeptide (TPR) repeat protein